MFSPKKEERKGLKNHSLATANYINQEYNKFVVQQ